MIFFVLFKNAVDLVKDFVNPEHAEEIAVYLTESFGNETRIDYGTGHEMAFSMFLMCLFKTDVLKKEDSKVAIVKIFNQ